MKRAIKNMVNEISGILNDCKPSIYLYGSSVLNDFRLGWSDIDILVLNASLISEMQARKLVRLHQTMLEKEPGNLYYRSFEGGMLTLEAFLSKQTDRVVYWGTSGERITNKYRFDSFGMAELLENGILLYGDDVRSRLKPPTYAELHADIVSHYESIRKHVQQAERSLYTFGWMLDIARCIYTLRSGKIIAKTDAGAWALDNGICPNPEVLDFALRVRREPMKYKLDKQTLDYAETLLVPIQSFADVLENELKESGGRCAKSLGQ